MNKEGTSIFQKHYPNICSVFEPVFDKFLIEEIRDEFFNNLARLYGLTEDKSVDFDKCLKNLYDMSLGKKHTFFDFLVTYLPNIPLIPPCMRELEESLGNSNINFEDKNGILNKLRESDQFWGKYCELEAAVNFAKIGCKVIVLHKEKSGDKYPDLEIKLGSHKINVEVSNRVYGINKDSEINALRNKVEDEAEQLPEDGLNIILFFVSDALMFSNRPDPKRKVNVFSFADALFNELSGVSFICSKEKKGKEVMKKTSILDTNEKLKHIDGLFIWYHGQCTLERLGKQSRILIPHVRKNFPAEVFEIFRNIQLADIKK